MTRFQVIRDFKHTAAMTPGQYLRDRRIRAAVELMRTDMPLAGIAAEVGFADQSHLTRLFKTMKGVSPGAYRAAIPAREAAVPPASLGTLVKLSEPKQEACFGRFNSPARSCDCGRAIGMVASGNRFAAESSCASNCNQSPLLAAAGRQPAAGHAEAAERPAPSGGILSLLPAPEVSDHSIVVSGRTLDYRAKAGTLSLLSGKGDVTAEVFYVAYTLSAGAGGEQDPQRPITFAFNGGPGAAAAYLNLGALGPRVIATAADGGFLPPPQRLLDNSSTWLDMTDLVFVDPVGTGYSREAPGQEARSFWGVDQDATSMGAFIRLYLAQAGRKASPVFLVGESYGGFRAALLARTLQEDVGISPSGIVLISPALEFTFLRPDEFQPLHWALELPSLAAVRLAGEGVTGPALRERLAEVERYALGDYLVALAGGLEQGVAWRAGASPNSRACRSSWSNETSRASPRRCSSRNSHVQEAISSAPMTARSKRPMSRRKVRPAARIRCSTGACRCSLPLSSAMRATS